MARKQKLPVGQCKLCLNEKELVGSHIIPKLFFRPIMKADGGIKTLDMEKGRLINHPKFQSGIKESLLCADCEKRFSSDEDFCRKSFYGIKPDNIQLQGFFYLPGHSRIIVKSIDSRRFLKFLYSVLWRAAASSHEIFQDIKIPSDLQEQLRNAVLGYPQNIDYGLVETLFFSIKQKNKDLINYANVQTLEDSHQGKRNGFRFTFGGMMIQFFIEGPKFDDNFQQLVLGSNKDMIYGAEINSEEHPNFQDLSKKIREMKEKGTWKD
jgi:hypothetical protein